MLVVRSQYKQSLHENFLDVNFPPAVLCKEVSLSNAFGHSWLVSKQMAAGDSVVKVAAGILC